MKKKKKKSNKQMAEHKPLERVKLDKLRRMIKSIERDYGGSPEIIDNMDITFEYIIASLFPNIMDNINKEFTHQYISGFNDRLKVKKVSMVEGLDNKDILNYTIDDLERSINNTAILISRDDISDNDKKVLKQICEVLETLKININELRGKND